MILPPHSPYMIIGAGIHGLSTAYHLALQLTATRLPRLQRPAVHPPTHGCPSQHFNQWFLSRFEKNTARSAASLKKTPREAGFSII